MDPYFKKTTERKEYMNTLEEISNNLKKHIEPALVDKLLEHYSKIKKNYRVNVHESAELNGSKFSEVVFRILENKKNPSGKFTPLDKEIKGFGDRCKEFEQLPRAEFPDDTIRIHIPRLITTLVDIRNKRAVGHISGIHSPNLMDSTLVVHCADWILAELIRLYHGCTTDEAQRIVEKIIEIDIPLIANLGDVQRVLDPKIKYPDQVLLFLMRSYPKKITDQNLYEWTEHSNQTLFRRDVLKRLHQTRKIEYKNGECLILPPGYKYIQDKINENDS